MIGEKAWIRDIGEMHDNVAALEGVNRFAIIRKSALLCKNFPSFLNSTVAAESIPMEENPASSNACITSRPRRPVDPVTMI